MIIIKRDCSPSLKISNHPARHEASKKENSNELSTKAIRNVFSKYFCMMADKLRKNSDVWSFIVTYSSDRLEVVGESCCRIFCAQR